MVFDRVVGAAGKELGDVRPPVAELAMGVEERPVLLHAPHVLLDRRIQLIVPALAALLAGPPGQMRGDDRPALGAVLLDEAADESVLLGRPELGAPIGTQARRLVGLLLVGAVGLLLVGAVGVCGGLSDFSRLCVISGRGVCGGTRSFAA